MTVFARFTDEFPEREETRILVLIDRSSGEEIDRLYLDERYCADPECDCRHVMLAVHNQDLEMRATIMYDLVGDASRAPRNANPYLEPGIEQPDGAEQVLGRVRVALDGDAVYRERLVRHYEEMKQRMRDPSHPLQTAVIEDRRLMKQAAESLVRSSLGLAGPSRERRERYRRKRRRKCK